jgi:hypothetical protein
LVRVGQVAHLLILCKAVRAATLLFLLLPLQAVGLDLTIITVALAVQAAVRNKTVQELLQVVVQRLIKDLRVEMQRPQLLQVPAVVVQV